MAICKIYFDEGNQSSRFSSQREITWKAIVKGSVGSRRFSLRGKEKQTPMQKEYKVALKIFLSHLRVFPRPGNMVHFSNNSDNHLWI